MAQGKHTTWQGHAILDEAHVPELETLAGVKEFRHKMPREEAEAAAHRDYMTERALDMAAHHFVGARAADAAGDESSARQHTELYVTAMKAAGHDPHKTPPKALLDRIAAARPKIYKFKPHEADALFEAPREIPHEDEPDLWAKLDELKALKTQLDGQPQDPAAVAPVKAPQA
jgi:hypothetical protein